MSVWLTGGFFPSLAQLKKAEKETHNNRDRFSIGCLADAIEAEKGGVINGLSTAS